MIVPDSTSALAMYSLDDLVEELQRRSSACIVALLRAIPPNEKHRDGAETETIWTHGGRYTCLGILQTAQARLLNTSEDDPLVEDEDGDGN